MKPENREAEELLKEARRDISILLSELDAHQDMTGEILEGDDAAIVEDIRKRWKPAQPTSGDTAYQVKEELNAKLDAALKTYLTIGIISIPFAVIAEKFHRGFWATPIFAAAGLLCGFAWIQHFARRKP